MDFNLPSYNPRDFLLHNAQETQYPLIYLNKEPAIKPGFPLVLLHLGPSGAGKDATAEVLLEKGIVVHAVTATSRMRRVDEDESESKYIWMRQRYENESEEEYDRNLIVEYDLIEHDRHFGGLYGLPKQSLYDAARRGIPMIRTEPIGAQTIINKLQNEFNFVVTFVVPESFEQLMQRIVKRGNVQDRLTKAAHEIEQAPAVTNYYLYNPVDYYGQSGLKRVQESFEMLVLYLKSQQV